MGGSLLLRLKDMPKFRGFKTIVANGCEGAHSLSWLSDTLVLKGCISEASNIVRAMHREQSIVNCTTHSRKKSRTVSTATYNCDIATCSQPPTTDTRTQAVRLSLMSRKALDSQSFCGGQEQIVK